MVLAQDGQILAVSQAWLDLTGYTRDELPTLAAWTRKAFGDNHVFVFQTILSHFDTEDRVFAGELTVRCRDGSTRLWDFGYQHLPRSPQGRRTLLCVATDVTEDRRCPGKAPSRGTSGNSGRPQP
jgi:PAS domain S-box-containing protein